MDNVNYEYKNGKNILTIKKNLNWQGWKTALIRKKGFEWKAERLILILFNNKRLSNSAVDAAWELFACSFWIILSSLSQHKKTVHISTNTSLSNLSALIDNKSSFQSLLFGTWIVLFIPFKNNLSEILFAALCPASSLSRHKKTSWRFGLSFNIWNKTRSETEQAAA